MEQTSLATSMDPKGTGPSGRPWTSLGPVDASLGTVNGSFPKALRSAARASVGL